MVRGVWRGHAVMKDAARARRPLVLLCKPETRDMHLPRLPRAAAALAPPAAPAAPALAAAAPAAAAALGERRALLEPRQVLHVDLDPVEALERTSPVGLTFWASVTH